MLCHILFIIYLSLIQVQERLATLDANEDYDLEVTTIDGIKQATENIIIHNKNYTPEKEEKPPETILKKPKPEKPPRKIVSPRPVSPKVAPEPPVISSCSLETAIQEFIEEVKFLETASPLPISPVEASSVTSNSDDDGTVSLAGSVASVQKSLVLRRASSTQSSQCSNPCILTKKPAAPSDLRYRWQRGFRKSTNGRYVKVPILRIAFDYDDTIELLPDELQFTLDGLDLCKVSRISRNKVFCEFQLEERKAYKARVKNTPKNADYEFSVSEFYVPINQLVESELGVWKTVSPEIVLK